jgi:hypothetical protein
VWLLTVNRSDTVARMGNTRKNTPQPTEQPGYEPPAVQVLGTLEELTRGAGPGVSPDDFSAVSTF